MKDSLEGTPSIVEWLTQNLASGNRVGINGMVVSTIAKNNLEMTLGASGIVLDADFDPLETIWPDRPALPDCKIFVHDEKYAGKSASHKIEDMLAETAAQHADAVLISALDEIAWALNIRSNDVKYNPVVTSFLYLSTREKVLFVDPAKLDNTVIDHLKSQGIDTLPYSDIKSFIANLPADIKVLVDESRTAAGIVDLLSRRCVKGHSVASVAKACKNSVQLNGVRAAMKRDGVAMVKALCEIQSRVKSGDSLTEIDVDKILHKYRSQSPMFFDESFGTIAGYGPHGAIVHYEADETSNSELRPQSLLLIDSGAQYLDGTTDITRTISLSDTPTADERRDFTLVMKGHIALGSAVFPAGTVGAQLDALARQYLWKEGLSYLHGTGHGVGHFLNVHEGPQSIRLNYVPAPLMPGMITSNEPGLYREGVHGIRCENLVLTVEAMTTEFGKFLRFETLTLCPFDRSLFDTSIMTNTEIEWVNEYHKHVLDTLSPELDGDALAWLMRNTAPLPLHS